MTQPTITLTVGAITLDLDPDLQWTDEFDWYAIEQTAERGLTGALIIDACKRQGGRPITLAPPDDSAGWLPRATLAQLQTCESDPDVDLTLSLRGTEYIVHFRRFDAAPIEARPVIFVADPLPGELGDYYLVTLRLVTL